LLIINKLNFFKIVFAWLILFFVLSGCGSSGNEAPSSIAPQPQWIKPVDNAMVFPQINTSFLVDVVDTNSLVTKVSFYVDEAWIYDDFEVPFEALWRFADSGIHTLKAIVWDNKGTASEALIDV